MRKTRDGWVNIACDVPRSMKDALLAAAAKEERPLANQVRFILREWLEANTEVP